MKIRNGFVSNSSSSSFLVMTTMRNHSRALEKLTDYERAVIKAMIKEHSDTTSLFNQDMICIVSTNTENYCSMSELKLEKKWKKYEEKENPGYYTDVRNTAWERYQELVKENPEEVFDWEFEC